MSEPGEQGGQPAGEPASGVLDIGVATGNGRSVGQRGAPKRSGGRALPRSALVILAVALGWLIGLLSGGSNSSTVSPAATPTSPPPAATAAAPAVLPSPVTPPAANEALEADPFDDEGLFTVVMVQAPLRGVAIPADVRVIADGVATRIDLDDDRLIAGATQGVVGQGDRRMLVVDGSVAFMALDSVMILDPVAKTTPVEVAKAIYLLPGSDPGHVWGVGSGSQTVTDIDVARRTAGREYDLSEIGAPLASYQGGLVIAPYDRSLGTFALWSPLDGIRPVDVEPGAAFVDAGGNLLVLVTSDGLAAYNTVTGDLQQSGFEISRSAQHRSIASPDGHRLAIAAQGTVAALPIVHIVDTATGEVVDKFATAFPWQLHWLSATEVLFISPMPDGVRVMVRDTATQTSRSVTDLATPNFWVTIAD